MREKKLIIRGIYLNYLYLLVNFVLLFLLTPFILNRLGQAKYGLWVIFSSVVGYFNYFSLGMNAAIAKYTAEYRAINKKEDLNRLISTTFIAFIFISILIILISLGLMPFIHHLFNIPGDLLYVAKVTFFIMGLNITLMLLAGVFGNIIYGYQRVDIWKLLAIIQLIVNSLLTVFFLRLGFGLIGIAIASVLSAFILIFLYWYFLKRSNYGIVINHKLANIKTLKEIMPYSIRTFVLGLTSQILYYTDNIVIGIFLGVILVTPYSISYKLCFLATYSFSVISETVFPRFSKLYALGDISGLRDLYLKITKISVAIMVPTGIFFFLFGHPFINLWAGEENFVGTNIFLVFIGMNILHAIGTPSGLVLQGIGKNKEFMYSEMIHAGLNIILSIILIQKIGLFGLALGTLFSNLCTTAWFIPLFLCKFLKLPIKKYILSGILPPLLIGVVVGRIAWLFRNKLFPTNNFFYLGLNGIIIIATYIAIYLVVVSSKEERQLYFSLFKRND
jgi:O-antigen/teichoic acid export membrane protein